ncbi:MAG: hypothetical protein B5M48_02065 [Candidatus Omnitrophica bacterium 4484_213]|nr:MAG: hypothetical protein B5M48_02065 [Candidatus Omnitrophica bacterium 4484_213]
MKIKRFMPLWSGVMLIVFLSGCARVERVRKPEEKSVLTITGAPISVSINVKAPDYPTLNQFKQKLSEIKGVKSIYQRKFSVSQTSELEIRYIGSVEKLADEIINMDFPDFTLEITDFDQTSINLKIVPLTTEQEY